MTTDVMTAKPRLPDDLWAKVPLDGRAAIIALVSVPSRNASRSRTDDVTVTYLSINAHYLLNK
jgi:hypothetical protein